MKRLEKLMCAALLAAAASARAELTVTTRPILKERFDGAWSVRVAGAAENSDFSVFDLAGNRVAGPFALDWFTVHSPKLWSDESPSCYRLVASSGTNREEKVFGFRTMVVRDGRLFVNGRPVRVKFAPKRLNGNAVPASRTTETRALLDGVYAIPGDIALQIAHERERATETATRHVFRNWAAIPTNFYGRVLVENRNAFTGADGVKLKWTLLVDGEAAGAGVFDLRGLGPGRSTVFDMPLAAEAARREGGTVSVRFDFVKNGFIIATDQADIVESREFEPLPKSGGLFGRGKVGFSKDAETMKFQAGNALSGGTLFAFDAAAGQPASFARTGLFDDCRPFLVSVRPAMEGEGAADFSKAMSVSPISEKDGSLVFAAVSRAEFRQPFRVDTTLAVTTFAEWTVNPSGIVSCRSRLNPSKNLRAGIAFTVATGDMKANAEWFGLGPEDNTPEECEGVFLGRWRRSFKGGAVKAESVRGVRVGDLTVRTLSAPFAIHVRDIGDGLAEVSVFAPGRDDDGTSELSFTLSARDSELTARGSRR